MCKLVKVQIGIDFAPFLVENDKCYYYYVYTPGGYTISNDNSVVQNFKKDIARKGNKEWRYRDEAVDKFALMLHQTLRGRNCTIIPCATSRPRGSLDFNDRLDVTVKKLGLLSPNYDIQFCLDTIKELTPSHAGGPRNPTDIMDNTGWTQPAQPPNQNIILVDDVLTTGAHFRAYKDIALQHYPSNNVMGIFLARYDGSSIHGCDATPL